MESAGWLWVVVSGVNQRVVRKGGAGAPAAAGSSMQGDVACCNGELSPGCGC